MRKLILAAILTTVCCHKPTTTSLASRLDECPCLDESDDPWTMHVLIAAAATGQLRGADGTDIADVEGSPSVCSPWEQGAVGTIAKLDGTTTTPVVGTNLGGGEDARCIDIDRDDHKDLVVMRDGGRKVTVLWGPSFGSSKIDIGAATNVQNWMQAVYADFTGDGIPELIAGGRASGAGWGLLTSATPRTAGSWSYSQIATAGWIMAMQAIDFNVDGDMDIFLTDRDGAGHVNANKGAWWYEHQLGPSPTWVGHQIAQIGGDPSFGDAGDLDGDGDTDVVAGNRTTLTIYENINSTWTPSSNLYPSNAGDLHGVLICDIDGAGAPDILTTYALSTTGESWVLWLEQDGTRHEISGPATATRKPDQPACYDVEGDGDNDVVFAEGGNDTTWTDDTGVGWFENPRL